MHIYKEKRGVELAQHTIKVSFRHPLYDLEIPKVPDDYRMVEPSSSSTANTDAPHALEGVESQELIDLARVVAPM